MFHKILVALDNSTSSRRVFEEALTLAKSVAAKLTLLHVLSSEEEGSPTVYLMPTPEYYVGLGASDEILQLRQKQWEDFVNRGIETLRSLAGEATTAGVTAEFSQNSGSPGRTICEFARNGGFDLIIVGRRGRSGLAELFLGSVSNYVLHHAPCSVLTVQQPVTINETASAEQVEATL